MRITYRALEGGSDPAHEVLFESPRFPGVIVLSFDVFLEPDGSHRPVNVGFEARVGISASRRVDEASSEESESGAYVTSFEIADPAEPPRQRRVEQSQIDVAALESVVLDYERYLQLARMVYG